VESRPSLRRSRQSISASDAKASFAFTTADAMLASRQKVEIGESLAGRMSDSGVRTHRTPGTWLTEAKQTPGACPSSKRPAYGIASLRDFEHTPRSDWSRYSRAGSFPKARLMALAMSSGFCEPISSRLPSENSSMTPRLPLTL
jgi:hypothetical protein